MKILLKCSLIWDQWGAFVSNSEDSKPVLWCSERYNFVLLFYDNRS